MPTPFPPSVSMMSLFLIAHCRRSSLLTEEGSRGWARSQIIRPRELWPSINHSILTGRNAIWGEQEQKSTGYSQSCRTVPLSEKFCIGLLCKMSAQVKKDFQLSYSTPHISCPRCDTLFSNTLSRSTCRKS
jgi:hypothetical protein